MITSIARYVTDFLLRENVICAEYADLYIYGFEVIQAGVVNIMKWIDILACILYAEEILRRISCGYISQM